MPGRRREEGPARRSGGRSGDRSAPAPGGSGKRSEGRHGAEIRTWTAVCDAGLEEVCAGELTALGAKNVHQGRRSVTFRGPLEIFYRAQIHLRTALRVLRPVAEFRIRNGDDLYEKAKDLPWEHYFGTEKSFILRGTVRSSLFQHSRFPLLKVKDAIADRFREKAGKRPDVDRDLPDCPVHLYLDGDHCILSLDGSGDSLHRRGYRLHSLEAPLSETLAAGLILLSGWDGKSSFVDPMCGSGTIAIEAVLYSLGIAPGLSRDDYAFKNWRDFDPALYNKVRAEAESGQRQGWEDGPMRGEAKEESGEANGPGEGAILVLASDRSHEALEVARENARMAGVESWIDFRESPFEELKAPSPSGVMVFNPPYGERLKEAELEGLYKTIGDTMKKGWSGWTAWILTGALEAAKSVGLKASRRIPLRNGDLDCRLLKYELYTGSKKSPQNDPAAIDD